MSKKKIDSVLKGVAATGIAIGGASAIQGADVVMAAVLEEEVKDEEEDEYASSTSDSVSDELSESEVETASESVIEVASVDETKVSAADRAEVASVSEVKSETKTETKTETKKETKTEERTITIKANTVTDYEYEEEETDVSHVGCIKNAHHVTLQGEGEYEVNGVSYWVNANGQITHYWKSSWGGGSWRT
ncbi:hypothetical protein, partial [Agathobacter ruminis]